MRILPIITNCQQNPFNPSCSYYFHPPSDHQYWVCPSSPMPLETLKGPIPSIYIIFLIVIERERDPTYHISSYIYIYRHYSLTALTTLNILSTSKDIFRARLALCSAPNSCASLQEWVKEWFHNCTKELAEFLAIFCLQTFEKW